MPPCGWILICILAFSFADLHAQSVDTTIRINQLGYYPNANKIAVVVNDNPSDQFYIISSNLKDTVYRGQLGAVKRSTNSSLKTRIADFSAFKKNGNFVLALSSGGYSYPFAIRHNINHDVAVSSLKGYYYQRVSMPLERRWAGIWSRPAGHPDTEVLIHPSAADQTRPANTKIATPGGWYDAGDYNKYIVNSGITMGTLFSAYEDFPSYFNALKTNIPESGDKVPDILNELLYNLRWMMTMQDPGDGGVYNKCTNAAFDGMVMPGVTKAPRFVVQKGTAATLDFAAVLAQAARVFKKFNGSLPGLSDSCLRAAVYAWQWCEKNPGLVYDQNAINRIYEPKVSTGGYGDRDFRDEWFWAATELLATTKDDRYYTVINQRLNDSISLPSWANVRMLGYYTLVRNQKQLASKYASDIDLIKVRLVAFANSLLANVNSNAFQTVMGQSPKDFVWGSNGVAANQGIALVNAYLLTNDKTYLNHALGNLDYIMGRNATGYCFVTGLGSKSTMHPHHRPSIADGIEAPVPGLLAGGPNLGRQDNCHYDFTEPETAYTDLACSYASNEIAINWNAPLVYLANAIEALQYPVGYSKK